MITTLVALTFFGGPVSPSEPDDYPKNPSVDALNYRFEISLSDETDEIRGTATISIRFRDAGVARIRLDVTRATPDRDGLGMTVSEVRRGDERLLFEHRDDALFIDLAQPSRVGDRRDFTVIYHGVPRTGLIIGPNKYGDRTFFSDNWPNKARQWLPTIDHPYDKATCEFIVTAPSHYQVVSNGLLVEETDDQEGRRRTHWKQSVPISTWLYVLGVARFAVQHVNDYQGKSIQTWVYPQDRDAGFYDFAVPTKDVLEFYGDRVGPFSYEKLANVQSNSVGGGMEAATAIFYGDNSVTGTRSERWRNVIIHEVAHQWFGNAVTEYDWDDVWLSEGFATYFTLLYIEHAYGRDEFVQGLNNSKRRIFAFYDENPDYRIVHDNLTDMRRVTSSQTYQKGGWTLHMLRGLVGEDAFWAGIQHYYRVHRDANATTEDFRRAMEDASGMDLEGFFHQWLYQGGALKLRGSWTYDTRRSVLAVGLDQVQDDGYLFQMPVQLGILVEGEDRPLVETVQITGLHNDFIIPLARQPERVVLDPNVWVLMDAQFGPAN